MYKKKLGIVAALVLLGGGFAAFTFAHDGGGNCCLVRLQQGIALTATTNAPSGATGKAELLGECSQGTNSTVLLIQTSGLDDGTYTVSVTDDTGTNTYVLGTFDVAISTNETGGCHHSRFPVCRILPFLCGRSVCPGLTNLPSATCVFSNGFDFMSWTNALSQCVSTNTNTFDVGVCTNFAGLWTNWFDTCSLTNCPSHHETNQVQTTGASFVLPTTLSATNVASVSIADSNSVVDLSGDFTNATNTVTCGFNAICNVTPGTNWPSITGCATLSFTAVHGREDCKFLLTAQGAPAGQKCSLFVNGAAAGTARSDEHGNVTIKNLHQKDLMSVKTVVVTDADHNVLFSASF